MSGRGPSSSDLAKRVEDLRMYRTNVRRYSTLDFKKRFQDQDRDIAGFGASAQRRKSLHVGEDDGEKGRRAYDVRLGARARSVRAAADEPFSSEEDGRLADSVARSRPSPSLRRPPDGAYPEVSDDDDDLNLDTRRHDRHRHDATSRSDDGLEGGRSGGRRVPHPEERKHPSGQRSSRQRYSGSSESDGEGSPRPRPSRGAWTRDTIIPAVNRRLSEKGRRSDERRPDYVDGGDSRPRHRSQERRRGETELREDDERHTSNRIAPASAPASPISEEDPFEEPYELDEPARSTERRALKTVPIEERPVDHKVPPNRLPQREYTKPIMIKREQQPRPVHEPQPQPDDLSAAVDVVREELKDVRSTIDETESPRASIDTTTRLLLKSVEEQSRLRALLEIRGVPADQDMATAAEARRAGEEADKRLTNTLNELERVVQQLVGVKAELETERRRNQELERGLVASNRQLEEAVAGQDTYRRELDSMSRDLRTLEGRLSAAEREAATARAGVTVPRLAYEDEPKEAGPENVAEQPITRMGVRLPYDGGIPKPILIRPNVHYYPASASLSTEPEDVTDDVSNKDKDYKDETAQYPPPAESPPQSPPSDYREDEQIAPLLSLDDSESSFQANARPPLSPKPRAASQQIPLSQLPVSKAKTKSEFIYLEINISDSQKQSIRIDTDSQPLELAYTFLEKYQLNPEYLIPLTEYITQTQDKLIDELDSFSRKNNGNTFASESCPTASPDGSPDTSFGEPYEINIPAARHVPYDPVSGPTGGRRKLADIARTEQERYHTESTELSSVESNNLDDETQKKSLSDKAVSDSPLDDKRVQIPKSKVAPGGFSFHTFEDLPERHIDNAGDESSLEFYLSPTASPGSRRSDRRESGVTERGISPMSVAATSPAGGSDLAALAALVESGRIQSISELLALVQSASSQGKSRLSELSPVLDVAPTLGPAVENAPSAVVSLESIQPLGDSIVLENLAIRRGNVLHTVTEKNKVVSFPDEASNTASNFSTGMIEAPVSLSKPQRPSRGLVPSRPVIPSKAPQISPSRHLVSPGTVVGSISQQTSRAATDSDHLRIHRHEKGVDGDERPVVEEVTVGASALVVSSEPSPQPRFPTLTHRDSYIQRHPTEIATKPFQLRSSVSSDSDESSFSSDSSSSPNLTLHLGDHDFDVVPLDEEEEDAEGMDLEEAAVVKAYIHHIINSNGHIAPTVDRDASQKLNSPSRTRFEVMPKTRDQHAVQKHNQLPGKNLSSALDLLNAAEAMNRPSQATNPIERIVAERRQRVAGMQATHEFNGIKVNMSGKGFGSERIVETVDYSDIIRTYEMHDNDHLRAEGPRVKASRKGFDNVDLLSRSEGAPRPVLFHAPVSSVPSAMSGHESGKTAGLHNAQSVKGHACAAEERPIAFGDYGLNVDSRHVTMDDEIHRKQTQRLQAGSSSIKRDTIPGPIDAASVMPAFTAIKPSRAAPSVQKYNHPATFLRSHTTGHATGDRHRNQSQVNIRRPAESSATIEVAVPPTRDSTEIERGRESLSDLLARLDQDSRKEAAGSRKEKPLMAPIRVLEPESSHSAHGDNAKRGGPGSTVNSKERLNILLLHPELLPYARPNAQKEGVLQKRHHSFCKGSAVSPLLRQLNPFSQEWQKRRYQLDFQKSTLTYFAETVSKQQDGDHRGVIFLSKDSEVSAVDVEDGADADRTFELGGVTRESKRRGQLMRSPSGRMRHTSDPSETDTASETEDSGHAVGSEIITLKAATAAECAEWVKAIKAAILMVSVGLSSSTASTKSPRRPLAIIPVAEESDADAAACETEGQVHILSKVESIDIFESKAASPTGHESSVKPDTLSSKPSLVDTSNSNQPAESPSLWSRVRKAVSSPKADKRAANIELSVRSAHDSPSVGSSGARSSDGVFFTPSPVQAGRSRASPWSPLPIIGGREEDVKSLDSSQFQLEQQVIHSFKRSRTPAMEKITSNQSYAINNSTDDTYICDLEDAGRMFEKATELAKSGKAPEAVPLFLQALKEFERLQLPELPQIQDEIGYWLETMEANYVERDPDVTTAANDDEEFFSPDREMGPATTVSTATATSTELSSAGKVPAGERVAKSPLMSTSSNVFYDVL